MTASDDMQIAPRLRHLASNLPNTEEVKKAAVTEGLSLELPGIWLAKLPENSELPGKYEPTEYGVDASLTWKAQEHLARSGRLAECDAMLVAEALEKASSDDGRKAFQDHLKEILFILSWPARTYSLHCKLGFECEMALEIVEGSPSVLLDQDLSRPWRRAGYEINMLDGTLQVPEKCPWAWLGEVLRAAADRLEEGTRMEADKVRGKPLPEEYRHFLSKAST